jgi:hypothetical protein
MSRIRDEILCVFRVKVCRVPNSQDLSIDSNAAVVISNDYPKRPSALLTHA